MAALEDQRKNATTPGRRWSFDGDGALLRLVTEAHRIRLGHLCDPFLAVHASRIEPLPHQITAVYGEMLPRQPLRFLLADDPGAGKTIMAGLLVRELMIRGDVERCLVVAPGALVEQWQDELRDKFGLPFAILASGQTPAKSAANPFADSNLLIARLDTLARNPDLQAKLRAAKEWDLVVCDEAHRMSASFFGGEVKHTRRYRLGQLLGGATRHLLLMTATPHNGKEEDFQLFMALLDADRFEGRFRDGVHHADVADLMRRLTKEELRRFDGRPLFPERRSYTVQYALSAAEAALYEEVTAYVREEMNRAERFADEGDGKRRANVGFALQILQRRLASSPAAIHESLSRRRERLEAHLAAERLIRLDPSQTVAQGVALATVTNTFPPWSADDEAEIEDAPAGEAEGIETAFVDFATAAGTIAELEAEITTLRRLEAHAAALRRSGTDAKWTQLNAILDHPLMTDAGGNRRKLIVFTEPRDTLNYLAERIRSRLGRPEAVVVIHGGVTRAERRKAALAFTHDKDVQVLVANDAAGEGINLQRAHLMVNYDLPWNPNRLEQRFGRIHRIGQTEVCHCWNLVAADTREGEVYSRLLDKIETARAALGGRVYDVLGRLFEAQPLGDLLMEAIRYGERPDIKQRLLRTVDDAGDRQRVHDLLADRALARDAMTADAIARVRDEMERAEARRLQPFHIQSFFLAAFQRLGGRLHKREAGRWEITHVPIALREHAQPATRAAPVQKRYERICFEKQRIDQPPAANYVCPGHPLLDATIDLTLERHGDVLTHGATLVDESDVGDAPRVIFHLEHAVQDAHGHRREISRRLLFLEVQADGRIRDAGPAPHLDFRPLKGAERPAVAAVLGAPWLAADIEKTVLAKANASIVPRHISEARERRNAEIDKVEREVTARLKKEINHWDRRAEDLKAQERAGKHTRLPSRQAANRADDLATRLHRRLAELAKARDITAPSPTIRGAALILPAGLLRTAAPRTNEQSASPSAQARAEVERLAMIAVAAAERALGYAPRDVSHENRGYDIESRDPLTGRLRFIEVKGRAAGNDTVTVTRNEILTALNTPDRFILAIVKVAGGTAQPPYYVIRPFAREPDFGATSVTYKLADLLARAREPR